MFSRPLPSRRWLAAVVAGVAVLASAGPARADVISFSGSRTGTDPVSFSGTMELTPAGPGAPAALKVVLNNTTSTGDAVKYGFITGFGFNLPAGVTATNTTPGSTYNFLNANDNATNLQGGEFDYAFSLSPTQLHTVSTSVIGQGIGAGQSATFTMNLAGNTAGLTAAQIIQELSAGSGSSKVPFSVRFRSTNTYKYQGTAPPDGDKVPVNYWKDITPPPPSNAVPAPPALILAGMGFGSILLGRLRTRRAKV